MEFVMIGLLVLGLLGLCTALAVLEREVRRQFWMLREVQTENAKFARLRLDTAVKYTHMALGELTKLHEEHAGTTKALESLLAEEPRAAESLEGIRTGLEALLRRGDAAEAVKELEALLKAAPPSLTPNEEVRLSRAVEEGMANILQYAAGKVPGVEVHL